MFGFSIGEESDMFEAKRQPLAESGKRPQARSKVLIGKPAKVAGAGTGSVSAECTGGYGIISSTVSDSGLDHNDVKCGGIDSLAAPLTKVERSDPAAGKEQG